MAINIDNNPQKDNDTTLKQQANSRGAGWAPRKDSRKSLPCCVLRASGFRVFGFTLGRGGGLGDFRVFRVLAFSGFVI